MLRLNVSVNNFSVMLGRRIRRRRGKRIGGGLGETMDWKNMGVWYIRSAQGGTL